MERRKIQLIAGTTYSVSLPKEWVKKNNLKEKNEIILHEKNDKTLLLSPHSLEGKKLEDVSLNIDDNIGNIDQILFSMYYLGVENITLFSKTDITKDIRSRIRKTMTHMSGTEISFEDKNKIKLKVLLDKSKIDINQLLYRINLIIDLSITNILEGIDLDEIRINENEIDRLYHLIAKIVSLSLIDSNVLHSSKINNVSLVPSYFLIGKRLENVGDNINHLSGYLNKRIAEFDSKKEILTFIKTQIERSINYLLKDKKIIFEKVTATDIKKINKLIFKIKDDTIRYHLQEMLRFMINIEEEIVNISFYSKLIKEGNL